MQAVRALPLQFEPNLGQAPEGVAATATAGDFDVRLGAAGLEVALPAEPRTLEARLRRIAEGRTAVARPPTTFSVLPGADAGAPAGAALEWVLEDRRPGVVHHLVGPPEAWIRDIPTYGRARAQVAPGVELVVRSDGGRLRYDYEVAAGVDPAALSWRFGAAERVAVAPTGDLALTVAGRELLQLRPRVFQQLEGRRVEVPARYRLQDGEARLEVRSHDAARPLLVDPVLVRADPGELDAPAVAVADDGSIYVSGQGTLDGEGARTSVMRLDADGALVWALALPAAISDVAVQGGRVAFTGTTGSPSYPVLNAWQDTFNDEAPMHPPTDAVVTVVDAATGELVFSTYFGSSSQFQQERELYNVDAGDAVAFTPSDGVVVGGHTENGGDFPATDGAVEEGARRGAFLARFSAAGALEMALTHGGLGCGSFGASVYDGYTGVAAAAPAAGGDVVWTGSTNAMSHAVTAAVQAQHSGAEACSLAGLTLDGWAARVSGPGDAWRFSTYLGGGPCTDDGWNDLVVGADGRVRLAGWRGAAGAMDSAFPTQCAEGTLHLPEPLTSGGPTVARLAGLASDGTVDFERTVFDGAGFNAVAALPGGDLVVGGVADVGGLDLPDAFQPTHAGGRDGLVAVLSPDGSTVRSGTYLGGSGSDVVWDVAAGPGDVIVAVGLTSSDDFPFSTPADVAFAGPAPFVAVLSLQSTDDDEDGGVEDDGGSEADGGAAGDDGGVEDDGGGGGLGDGGLQGGEDDGGVDDDGGPEDDGGVADGGAEDGGTGADGGTDADGGTPDGGPADAGGTVTDGGAAGGADAGTGDRAPGTPQDDGGCASTGAGGSSLMALLLLGLAATRRRRGGPA